MILELVTLLVAAKAAAEIAERLNIPAVVAEIVAGVALGPSALGLVGTEGEALAFLAELGVVLLLLQVGLEMDLAELGAVGRASLVVAAVGVVLPFGGGWAAARALDYSTESAIFVGAALTATSVGITARVFGDLRALATVEARTVLGAAVADDVLGLVILTVVVKLVDTGSVGASTVAGVLAAAIGFLVVAGVAGARLAPLLFRLVDRAARSAGTLVAFALAFALGLAQLAGVAGLAPIIGAFLAGLALARTDQAERVRRDLTPIGHILIPLFFVRIGLDTDVTKFADPRVLAIAGALAAVAVVGKIAAAVGSFGIAADRWLIGLGMLPRGEVGLIFAGIGLRSGVLGTDLYAALLLIVLLTTLATPPLLRWRLATVRAARRLPTEVVPVPEGGWLAVEDGHIELRGEPAPSVALHLALEAARLAAMARPAELLLNWFGRLPQDEPLAWDDAARAELLALLREGNARSWRFLDLTGVLDRVLPELASAMGRRRADASELDPAQVLRWTTVEALVRMANEHDPEFVRLERPDRVLLAALLVDITGGRGDAPVDVAGALVDRLDLGADAANEVTAMVAERGRLRAAALRPDGLEEAQIAALAAHFEHAERARALYVLERSDDLEGWQRERLDALHERLQQLLVRDEIEGPGIRSLAEARRAEAQELAGAATTRDRLAHAPVPWLVLQPTADLVRQAALLEPLPRAGQVRSLARDGRVELACRDRSGLLARVTGVLAEADLSVLSAITATWGDGGVVMAFDVDGPAVDEGGLEARLEASLRGPVTAPPVPDAVVNFDGDASPWYTIADIEAVDRPGLLHAIAAAMTQAGVSIHGARVATVSGRANDRFELTDRRGEKLTEAAMENVRVALASGVGRRTALRAKTPRS